MAEYFPLLYPRQLKEYSPQRGQDASGTSHWPHMFVPVLAQRSGGRAAMPAGLPGVVLQAFSQDFPHGIFHRIAEYCRVPMLVQ
jgi:hypothetical protein